MSFESSVVSFRPGSCLDVDGVAFADQRAVWHYDRLIAERIGTSPTLAVDHIKVTRTTARRLGERFSNAANCVEPHFQPTLTAKTKLEGKPVVSD